MENTVHVVMVVDRSGSMASRANDVRGGFNAYIEKLADDVQTNYRVSLTLFDHSITHLYVDRPLEEVPELTAQNYVPSGMTALYDALGDTLRQFRERVGTEKKRYGEDRVLVVVITDGEENASSSYSGEHVRSMIQHREEAGNYTFVYLGADQNAWSHASVLSVSQGNSISFHGSEFEVMFQNLAASTTAYSHSGVTSTRDFSSTYYPTSETD